MLVIDAQARSFIDVAADHPFPIQNLPYGVFRRAGQSRAAVGVAIGDYVLDLRLLSERGLLDLPELAGQRPLAEESLNAFMALGRAAWVAVRGRLFELLSADTPTLRDDAALRQAAQVPQSLVRMELPAAIGDYTDFYSSRYHAENVGTMIRGAENALQPNWLHLPVAYHGRASSVVISGTPVRRPLGQTMADGATSPRFGPSRALDYELEMGFFIGPGNNLGEPITAAAAQPQIFGLVLVNDWSARDLQKWEYQPLGPFLAKNFATTISPWVVTLDALEPFRTAGPVQDHAPLPYLQVNQDAAYSIELLATLRPGQGGGDANAQATEICRSNFKHLYWAMTQQLAHHTISGCNLRPGDLLASGTISGPTPESRGCLLERTWGGRDPITLADGSQRRFLEDGDEVTLSAWCQGDGYRIGFGEATGVVLPAVSL